MAKNKKTDIVKQEGGVKHIDLSELSLTDLLGLQNALPGIIEQAKKTEKAALIEKMEALAAESGFELSEVFNAKTGTAKKKRKQIGFVKAKYINPDNAEQTWTGRGRKPKWATQYIKNGGALEELLINPEAG